MWQCFLTQAERMLRSLGITSRWRNSSTLRYLITLFGRDVTDDRENYVLGTFYSSDRRLILLTAIISKLEKEEEYRNLQNFKWIVYFLIIEYVGYVVRKDLIFLMGCCGQRDNPSDCHKKDRKFLNLLITLLTCKLK